MKTKPAFCACCGNGGEDWRAIIDAIERRSVRYYEDRGAGRIETTQETLIDYKRRVVETEALIQKLTLADS
jgi:hypothetical protein